MFSTSHGAIEQKCDVSNYIGMCHCEVLGTRSAFKSRATTVCGRGEVGEEPRIRLMRITNYGDVVQVNSLRIPFEIRIPVTQLIIRNYGGAYP